MLIDEVKVRITAGHGGDGSASFNKNLMTLGPVGGNGGNGGSVYLEGVSDLSALNQFRFQKEIKADDGQEGRSQFRDGHNAQDKVLKIPVGTVVYDLKKRKKFEIDKVGQRVLLLRGGQGGKGNFHFRSSTNTTPKEFQPGRPGGSRDFRFELKMIADAGFVGLPNVGKSTLLNHLSNAKSKVANYEFTTLEPNLGVYNGLILADIPGLIAGASSGKGLGIKFLRHVERTKTLFHFIAADSVDPVGDYKIIRGELGKYNKNLLNKPEHILISKSDLISEQDIDLIVLKLAEFNKKVVSISVNQADSLLEVQKILDVLIQEKQQD
jgi:GTPase